MTEDPKELISLDEKSKLLDGIKHGSNMLILEFATAIQVGKLPPFGYDVAASFLKNEQGKVKKAHSAWLLAEAEIANKKGDLDKEFPDTQNNIDNAIADITSISEYMNSLKQEIAKPNWDYRQSLRRDKVMRSAYFTTAPKKDSN